MGEEFNQWLGREARKMIEASGASRPYSRKPRHSNWSDEDQALFEFIRSDEEIRKAVQLKYFDPPSPFEDGISDDDFAALIAEMFVGMRKLIADRSSQKHS